MTALAAPAPATPVGEPDYQRYETVAPLFEELAACVPGSPRHAELTGRLAIVHLPLARNLAGRFAARGEPMDDLVQVARVGLLRAIVRFDPGRDVGFLSFAIPTIIGDLRRYFRDQTWDVRIPRRLQELNARIREAIIELAQCPSDGPTTARLAEHLGVAPDEVDEGLRAGAAYRALSLDLPVSFGGLGAVSLGDTLGAVEPGFAAVDHHVALGPLLAALSDRERRVLHLRFVDELNQSQIAREIGTSQMYVSRLLMKTIARLRTQLLAD